MYFSKDFKNRIFEIFQKFIVKMGINFATSLKFLKRKRLINVFSRPDYIRLSSLELIADEIYSNNVSGSVCELGVYQGDFAKYINLAFKDRKLYLFDTFKGFDSKDIQIELKNKYSTVEENFSDTHMDLVLKKMKYPQNCVIKKGYFPESAAKLEDEFAFVNIDVDLYNPTYEGLKYFYPRLSKKGYIFVHDYNNDMYMGVKQAVKQFCKENDITFFPLSDCCGSAIIIK